MDVILKGVRQSIVLVAPLSYHAEWIKVVEKYKKE